MKRFCTFVLCFGLLTVFSGCMRYSSPNQPQNQQQLKRNPQPTPIRGESPQISSTTDRAMYYYGVATNDVKAQTGMDGSSNIKTYNITSGDRIRVIGKYDGYNVAVLPNNQMGLVPARNIRPEPPQPPRMPTIPQPGNTTKGITGGNGSAAGGVSPAEAATMINLVNQSRSGASLKPLSSNKELTNIANLKASDIAAKNYFSHTSPTYGSPFDMMKKYSISYLYAGENLALNQNVQAAEQALMNSPGHKANILSQNFTDIGIGIAQKSDGSRVYVQMFIGR